MNLYYLLLATVLGSPFLTWMLYLKSFPVPWLGMLPLILYIALLQALRWPKWWFDLTHLRQGTNMYSVSAPILDVRTRYPIKSTVRCVRPGPGHKQWLNRVGVIISHEDHDLCVWFQEQRRKVILHVYEVEQADMVQIGLNVTDRRQGRERKRKLTSQGETDKIG